MLRLKKIRSIAAAATLAMATLAAASMSGCAASNSNGKIIAIFFPKERAVKAADSVIDDIMGVSAMPAIAPAPAPATGATERRVIEVTKK
jgi:hypothetical protein